MRSPSNARTRRPRGAASERAGWREWVSLPELGIDCLKAKLDTGARTSALHALHMERFRARRTDWVRFLVHPEQRSDRISIPCAAPILDERMVSDSGGHRERRLVIETELCLGTQGWRIELTLTDRAAMRFRMLVGRTALSGHFFVDPGVSYCAGTRPKPQIGA